MARERRVLYNEPMRVTIRQKDLEMTDSLREYIDRKVVFPVRKRLKRLAQLDAATLDIEASRITHHHHKGMVYAVSASLAMANKLIRAEAADEEIHAACDALKDELTREIVAYKTKSRSILRRGARKAKQYLRFSPGAWFWRLRA